MQEDFRVFFNNRRQFFKVFLHDTSPNSFQRRGGGRWGYFTATYDHPRRGEFGEIHLVKSRVRVDSVSHELDHLRCHWLMADLDTKYFVINVWNEEWFCKFGDTLTRNFWREYGRFIRIREK